MATNVYILPGSGTIQFTDSSGTPQTVTIDGSTQNFLNFIGDTANPSGGYLLMSIQDNVSNILYPGVTDAGLGSVTNRWRLYGTRADLSPGSAAPSIIFGSSGTISTPSTGWTWFDGTNLFFYNGSTTTILSSGVSGTSGQVAYFNGTNSITSSSGLTYNSSNVRLGIGISSPSVALHLTGAMYLDANNTNGSNLASYFGAGVTRNFGSWRNDNLNILPFGRVINQNPEFLDGTTGYGVYDNNNSSTVTIAPAADTTSPSPSGNAVQVTYNGSSGATPGLGGIRISISGTTGAVTGYQYKAGNRLAHVIWANIPSGYTVNFATNSMGTGGTYTWMTAQAGTGNWFQYVVFQSLGTDAIAAQSYFYLTGTLAAFSWSLGSYWVIDMDQSDGRVVPDINVGYLAGANIGFGDIANVGNVYLAQTSGKSVGIGTLTLSNGFVTIRKPTSGTALAVRNTADSATTFSVTDAGVVTGTSLTLTGMTAGSVLFAGASGAVSQNNSYFFWNNSTNQLNLGPTTSGQRLNIAAGNLQFTPVANATAPTVAVGSAGVLTGNYFYVVTYVTAIGETRCATPSSVVAPSSQQVNLTAISVSTNPDVTSKNIYRTTTGGVSAGPYFLVANIAASATTYTDNTADGSLGTVDNTNRENTTGAWFYTNGQKSGLLGQTNTAFGYQSLGNITSGYANVVYGIAAGAALTTGNFNVLLGWTSGQSLTTATGNVIIGQSGASLVSTTNLVAIGGAIFQTSTGSSGSNSVAIGSGIALAASGSNLVLIGTNAGRSLSSGGNSVLIGYQAGYAPANNSSNATNTGANNTFVGYQSGQASSTQVSLSLALGYQALVTGSNQAAIGGTGANALKVGINNSNPTAQLSLVTDAVGTVGILVNGATSQTGDLQQWQVNGSNMLQVSAAGKLTFNNDSSADLYWSSSGTLKMDGNLTIGGNQNNATVLQFGSGASSFGFMYFSSAFLNTTTTSTSVGHIAIQLNQGASSNSSANFFGISSQSGTSGANVNYTGFSASYQSSFVHRTTGNITLYVGYQAQGMSFSSTGTASTVVGFYVSNQGNALITTSYGVRILAQSGSTTNYGLYFDGTGVSNGINWGGTSTVLYSTGSGAVAITGTLTTSAGITATTGNITSTAGQIIAPTTGISGGLLVGGDAQLYRSAASTWRTPATLIIDGTLSVGTTGTGFTGNFVSAGVNVLGATGVNTTTSGTSSTTNFTHTLNPSGSSSVADRAFIFSLQTPNGNTQSMSNMSYGVWAEARISASGSANGFAPINVTTVWNASPAAVATITSNPGILINTFGANASTLSAGSTVVHTAGVEIIQGTLNSQSANITITGQAGVVIAALSNATNNTLVLLGTQTIPSGNFGIYFSSTGTSNGINWGGSTAAIYASSTSAVAITGTLTTSAGITATTGNITSTAGQLIAPTTGSGAGLLIGGDVQLYRSAANTWRTPDTFIIDGTLSVGSVSTPFTGYFASTGTNVLGATGTNTATTGTANTTNFTHTMNPGSTSSASDRAFVFSLQTPNGNTQSIGANYGLWVEARLNASGTISGVIAPQFIETIWAASPAAVATIATNIQLYVTTFSANPSTLSAGSTVTKVVGIEVDQGSLNSQAANITITGQAGLAISAMNYAANNALILLGGTTTPSGNFGIYFFSTGTSNGINWGGSTAAIYASSTSALQMTGTLTISNTLTVTAGGATVTSGTLTLNNTGGANGPQIKLATSSAPSSLTAGSIWWDGTNLNLYTGSATVVLSGGITGSGTSGQLAYWNGTSSLTGNANMTFDGTNMTVSTGSLFVGPSSGSNIKLTSNVIQGTFSTETNPRWFIAQNSIASGVAGATFGPGGSSTIAATGSGIGMATTDTAVLRFYTSNGTALTERGRIDGSGNFALGTTTISGFVTLHKSTSGTVLAVRDTSDATSVFSVSTGGTVQTNGLVVNAANPLTLYNSGGTFYSAFQDGGSTQNIIYLMPVTAPVTGQFLTATTPSSGNSTLSWANPTTGAGGSNTQIQFNNGGTLAGSANLTWTTGTNTLAVTGTVNATTVQINSIDAQALMIAYSIALG